MDIDINDIKTYLIYGNQKIAIMQAMRNGINKKKFFEMKKNAGFTNWTFEKRKYKKELKLKEFQDKNEDNNIIFEEIDKNEDNNIIFEEIDQDNNEDIEIPYIKWSNIEKIE
jgi:hypothetical protein